MTGLKTVEIEWEKDAKGGWKMVEKEGTEKIHECDLCILAMGFVGPEKVYFLNYSNIFYIKSQQIDGN
jgi:glutamate synthase (NADPH/NADH)